MKDQIKEEKNISERIDQNQLYSIITDKNPDWHTIIYDLINSEQLDPWDINIIQLTNKYFERILYLEESDFYISSKVLLAAALLLRIKSDFLLNRHLKTIDEILFGKKQKKENIIESIEIDEDNLPMLIPKTPLPRFKKVTLDELMKALDKAIKTESRKIKKEVNLRRAKKLSEIDFPEFKKIDLKDRIRTLYVKILTVLKQSKKPAKDSKIISDRIEYSKLIGTQREERLACFLPLLHLSNNKKLWLGQERHLEEIWVSLYSSFEGNKELFLKELESELEEEIVSAKEEIINNKEE